MDIEKYRDDINFHISGIDQVTMKMVDVKLREPFTISGGTSGKSFKPIVILIQGKSGSVGISTLDNFPKSSYDGNGTEVSWTTLKQDYLPIFFKRFHKKEETSIFDVYEFLHGIRDYNPFAVSALEMAIWDLLGKEKKHPCHELFYTVFKRLLRDYHYEHDFPRLFENPELDTLRESRLEHGLKSKMSVGLKQRYHEYDNIIALGKKRGVNVFKFKITPQPRYNIELLEYIRDTFPDIIIDTDANGSFVPIRNLLDKPDIKPLLRVYEEMNISNPRMHEQPSIFDKDHMSIFKQLQTYSNVPLCPDESIHSFHDIVNFSKMAQELDKSIFANIKIHRSGGIIECIKILALLTLHNNLHPEVKIIPWGGYMPDQEIATNALLHLFSLPVETSHTDATDHDYWFRDSLFDRSFTILNGTIKIIKGEGLGLRLNPDMVNRLTLKNHILK